jgi:hypothetical protein
MKPVSPEYEARSLQFNPALVPCTLLAFCFVTFFKPFFWVGRCGEPLADNVALEQGFLPVLVCFLSYQHFPLISILIRSSLQLTASSNTTLEALRPFRISPSFVSFVCLPLRLFSAYYLFYSAPCFRFIPLPFSLSLFLLHFSPFYLPLDSSYRSVLCPVRNG